VIEVILLITIEDDLHTDLVEEHLKNNNADYFRLNTDVLSRNYHITYGIRRQTPFVSIEDSGGRHVNRHDISSVWYRRTRPNPPEGQSGSQHLSEYRFDEYVGFFKNLWAALAHADWMDDPEIVHRLQDHRVEQYRYATQVGLEVPDTYYTNDGLIPIRALEEKGQVAIKPIIQPFVPTEEPDDEMPAMRVLTKLVREGEFEDEQLMVSSKNTPIQFQDYVEKSAEIRLTIVGDKLFPCEIDSQASERTKHDWRRYDFQKVAHRQCELPEDVMSKVSKLMELTGLVFGAMDLIRTPDGRFVFLEVNPAGQWQWIEVMTGMPIAKAIADWLIEHNG